MIRALALTPLPALLMAQAPSPEPPVAKGWVRHRLKLGPLRLEIDTPARLSPLQEFPPLLEEAVNLDRIRLRRPEDPVTEGLTLFCALFDLESPILGLPKGQLELSIFAGEYQPGPQNQGLEAFSESFRAEFSAILSTLGQAGRAKVMEDFHPVRVGGKPALGLRVLQDQVETWHHFFPSNAKVYIDLQFRILPRPKAEPTEVAQLRALADRILQGVRIREIAPNPGPKPQGLPDSISQRWRSRAKSSPSRLAAE